MRARPGYDASILLGNCIIRANGENPNIKEKIKVKGCPPKFKDVIAALKKAGLEINEEAYFKYLINRTGNATVWRIISGIFTKRGLSLTIRG